MADNVVSVNFTAQTAGFARGVSDVKGQVESLNQRLNEAFSRSSEAIRLPLDALAEFKSSLRETAEVAGAAFGFEKLKEFSVEMAETGERAMNTAFALGITVAQLGKLQGIFTLAGGSADDAQRTFERLGQAVQQAISNPTSQAATTFQNLGISLEEVRSKGGNLVDFFRLLIERYDQLTPSLQNIGALHQLLGRQVDTLIPLFREGAGAFDEMAEKSKDYQRAMTAATPIEAAEAESLNRLKLETMTLAHDAFAALAPMIRSATDGLTDFLKEVDDTIQSTKIDIQNIMALGDAFQNFLSKITGGFIPKAAPTVQLPDVTVTGTRPIGTAKAGGARGGGAEKGQADELATWREQLQQKLEAERNFFADSKAEELAFWQQKLALTSAGSKEQAQVQTIIYGLQKSMAQEGLRAAEEAESQQESLDKKYLDAFSRNMKLLIAEKQITLRQAIGFEIQYTAQVEEQEKKRLEAFLNDDRLSQAEKKQYYDRLLALEADYDSKIADLQVKAADDAANSWKDATKQISDAFATALTDVLTRTKSFTQAMDDLLKSLIKDTLTSGLKSLFNSALGVGGAGGGAGGGGGGGLLGGAFSALGSKLFGGGLSSLLGGLGAGGAQDFAGGILGAGSELGAAGADVAVSSGGGGLLSGLMSFLPALFAFEKGGIVPSAQGGWAVPSLNGGSTLAQLHSNEMVLPANISQGLQGMIGGGGGGISANFNVSAVDSQSVATFFRQNGSLLVQALNRAMRNGAALQQPG